MSEEKKTGENPTQGQEYPPEAECYNGRGELHKKR